MRAELPWNVAGIPPEVREAARAAARREGLSVGEWLTRRIVQSFSDFGEDAPSHERPYERSAPLWSLATVRRDTEDMLGRVGRSEAEASDAFRRIEDHLRSVTRRLDCAERSQSENNRAVNKAASEINIASREQAQAFDQLGSYVVGINDRLERLERTAAQDGLKTAVKALHSGLSHLADQLTQTAAQSAGQVSAMSRNLEQMAERLGQVHAEVDSTGKRLEARVSAVEEETRGRFAAFETEVQQYLDQRLAEAEKPIAFDTSALDQVMEQLEAQAGLRAGDQAELQKRHVQTDDAIGRLSESVEKLESRINEPSVQRRLDAIEQALASLVSQLETYDPAAPLQEMLRDLSRRIDAVEKNRDDVTDGDGPADVEAIAAAPPYEPAPLEGQDAEPAPSDSEPVPEDNSEAPPFAEPVQAGDGEAPVFESHEDDPLADAYAPVSFATDSLAEDSLAPDASAPGAFAPGGEDALHAVDENFLAVARRSARAAAGKSTPQRSKLVVPLIIAIGLVLALFAGITFSQRLTPNHPGAAPEPKTSKAPTSQAKAPFLNPPPTDQSKTDTDAALVTPTIPAQPEATAPAVAPQPPAPTPRTFASSKASVPTLDRITQLANSGSATAETILGLKELDGDGLPANPGDGVKWLERAAQQGQSVAQYRLGAAYERGQGVAANPPMAVHWYQLAATQGNRKAMHNLAVAYAGGIAGRKDMAEAARWFAKAADLGLADSQFNLAVLYERGDGVPQSLLDAYKWYAIAAGQGDAESKTRLSVIAPQLSADDRNAAQKSAASFRAAALDRTANVPPEIADIAGN